jgi:TRAP-type mannitol/chloroaromatic compound transport system permease large subunit
MIGLLLFGVFVALMIFGVPIGVAMGLAATLAIALANLDTLWFGLLAVPQNFYASLGKYPLLALPMFILVGTIFERSGVAIRLVNLAVAMILGVAFLSEPLTPGMLVGFPLVVVGSYLASRRRQAFVRKSKQGVLSGDKEAEMPETL